MHKNEVTDSKCTRTLHTEKWTKTTDAPNAQDMNNWYLLVRFRILENFEGAVMRE